jgi:hypothetical protein
MTREEADELMASIIAKMEEKGLPLPSEVYKNFWRATLIYDELSGDYTSRRVSINWANPNHRLAHWSGKMKEWRALQATSPEVYKYIVEQIKEVRSGGLAV